MAIIQHSTVTGADLHGIIAYTVATTVARDALEVTPADIGKVARVSVDNSFYILTSTSPAVWSPTGAPPITSIANISGGTAGAIPYQTAPSTTALLSAGTAGQVLTSNGNAAPTWQLPASGFSGGTVSGATAFTSAAPQITLGVTGSAAGKIVAADSTALTISGGDSISTAGGKLELTGGSGTATSLGGEVRILSGTGYSGGEINIIAANDGGFGAGSGGNITISAGRGGQGVGSAGGSITLNTGTGYSANGALIIKSNSVELFRFLATGAFSVGTTGTAYGTSGQVLTSNGNAAPTWKAVTAPSTFSGDVAISGLTVGRGAGNIVSNTAYGASALKVNTTGIENTAVGGFSLDKNTTGQGNAAIGYKVMTANTSGSYNTGVGASALMSVTTASNNVAVGYNALRALSTGVGNIGIGLQALYFTTNGPSNIGVGQSVLQNNTTGARNVAIGEGAGFAAANSGIGNVSGSNNVYLGHAACGNGNANTNEIVIGANALGAGSNSVVLGSSSTTKTVLYGAVAIGGGINYGTSGQVLTSNGNAAPTWTTPAAAGSVTTDANNTYTKAQRGSVVALTAGSTVTADFNAANNFNLLTNQTFTMAFPTNVVAGQSGVIVITQDATGGRVVTWATGWVAGDGATPILSTAANAVDYIYYYTESSSRIMVSVTKNVR